MAKAHRAGARGTASRASGVAPAATARRMTVLAVAVAAVAAAAPSAETLSFAWVIPFRIDERKRLLSLATPVPLAICGSSFKLTRCFKWHLPQSAPERRGVGA